MRRFWQFGSLILLCVCLVAFPVECRAEIAGADAFEGLVWEKVYEEKRLGESGIVQSVCVTEDYIICIENTSDYTGEPDVVSAYYRGEKDKDGNPVQPYTLAKRVADTDWEHGNGMAYNPNTHEIYVALYTDKNPENRGCLYVMDPDTLQMKRKIKVSNEYNILGIGYQKDKDRYVIQTNVDGGYSFKILDAEFQLVEDLGEYADTAEGENFQDLCVTEDYIINFPLTYGMGIGDFIHIYSISQKRLLAAPKLNFRFEQVTEDEPEALCELEPGVFLAVVNVAKENGERTFCFYRTEVPYYFNVKVETENGRAAIQEKKVLKGKSLLIDYLPETGFQLSGLTVDGKEQTVNTEAESYVLKNVSKDHIVRLTFSKIPKDMRLVYQGILVALVVLMIFATYLWMIHVKRERLRKRSRARIARQRVMWERELEMRDLFGEDEE